MGPSQGRHSALATTRIVARETGRRVGDIGVTTARPPFGPEKPGLLAGPLRERYRLTAMHDWHRKAGAAMVAAGNWRRPLHYAGKAADPRRGDGRRGPGGAAGLAVGIFVDIAAAECFHAAVGDRCPNVRQ